MSKIRIKNCSCIDFPACGHEDYAYTGEDAVREACEDEFRDMYSEHERELFDREFDLIMTDYECETPLGRELGDGTEVDY